MESQSLLDEHHEQDEQSKTGHITEDDVFQSVAKQIGWTPKEEWKRDPDKWVDARTFLQKTPEEIKTLKERLKRTGQAAEHVIEENNRRLRVQFEAELKAAVEAKDPEGAKAAAERLADVKAEENRPHPATVRWIERNAWFEDDPDARALAESAVLRAHKQGLSIEEQLEAAEKAVKPRFPEYFPSERRAEEHKEVRLSDRKAPQVAEGSRTTRTTPKDKSFADMPAGDRAEYKKRFQKRFESMGLKPEEAEARYARAYWNNKGE
jgi:hypothetical protein